MFIYLYDEAATPTLDLGGITNYIKDKLPSSQIEVRENFITFHLARLERRGREEKMSHLAEELARAKVRKLGAPLNDLFVPLKGEIGYERRRLENQNKRVAGILYDGFVLSGILQGLLPPEECALNQVHIVFTNQLFGTWDEHDRRYHARVSIYNKPSLISTTGIVEAPAKPREYYLLKQQYTALGMYDAAEVGLKGNFRGRFIDYNDERMTRVMKGYVLQALMHQLTGEPFCTDKSCRLYNAHWQEEVIRSQVENPYDLCPAHERMLEALLS
ncbi:MAG: hypothetical protein M1136_08075 [Chloroflexi bacterium]|nr:hypothetical protein [Chloroflexota bacterium]MCL5075590.1 hypothetical protein [Chloroflexota bacterium]